MSTRMPAPNRKKPEYLYLSLVGADDVPCFASCVPRKTASLFMRSKPAGKLASRMDFQCAGNFERGFPKQRLPTFILRT
jgi:hypothetical protein